MDGLRAHNLYGFLTGDDRKQMPIEGSGEKARALRRHERHDLVSPCEGRDDESIRHRLPKCRQIWIDAFASADAREPVAEPGNDLVEHQEAARGVAQLSNELEEPRLQEKTAA